MTNFTQVGEFMTTFGQEVVTVPAHPSTSVANLRLDLIQEEVDELTYAIDNNNLVEIADALTDILYVVYGAGHAYGIDLDKCFDEVHASNMSKLNEEGKPIYREDGKVLKGSNYFEPNLSQFLFERSETGHP
jgi:predicted HAD superfamily Cof-like phosphohydrolase|tara:strand:+ start:709 stop:1104 length:396 start_codon:yes stop_codon:yes gene_type:complete